jgi:hypothetical protein
MALQTPLADSSNSWVAYDQWIQEDADKASLTAASPENALILVGPNRKTTDIAKLSPVGMLQNFTVGQNINWQAQQMIGSGRTFFLAGKAPGNGQISRLFTSQRTLLNALYKNVIGTSELLPTDLESPYYETNPTAMFTLDSELLKIPFGMAALFRDVTKRFIGGFYVEHMVIPNLNLGFAVGQPAIFETVSVYFDRVVPFDISIFGMIDAGKAAKATTKFEAAISGPLTK